MRKARTVAVTGASRGIGASIALELARRRFTVGCFTRKGTIPETEGAPREAVERLLGFRCDVTDEASVRRALSDLAARSGAINGLVNNAGIHLAARSHEMTTETYEKVMAVNATAVFAACREAFPHLAKAGGGIIVNVGSFFDKLGVKRNLAYCASKAAVGAMTRCLAVEWGARGIRVVDVAPGYIETDLTRGALEQGPLRDFLAKRIPGGRHGTGAEVARLVAAIFSEDIPFLTGETIYLDGGQGVAH
jgi:NAD(P)-dependent dehydrogenase (short-subunit alcohol dehydrogenase family)